MMSVMLNRSRTQPVPEIKTLTTPPVANLSSPIVTNNALIAAVALSSATNTPAFQLRPFAVVKETDEYQWTAEDGRDASVIRQLAHNEVEVRRLTEENLRVKRRQLVYCKTPVWGLVEQAKATDERLQKLTLPGLDGQVLEMEVTRADLAPSGLSGTFAGNITGHGKSLVTLAFKQGREAFTVESPEQGIFLQGHPREPGEIMITSFDPDVYLPLPGGEPIKTGESLPTFK